MSVTERLMGAGSWSLDLSPDTPRNILRAVDPETAAFKQIIITDVAVDVDSLTDAGMLGIARYAGVYRRLDGTTMSGAGMAAMLGDEDGKGDIFEGARSGTRTLAEWVDDIAPSFVTGLTIGSVASTATWTTSFRFINPREALDLLCSHFGMEWRVRPSLTLDVAASATLFGSTPAVLIVTDGEGGRDLDVTGVRATSSRSVDVEGYATKVVYVTDMDAGTFNIATRADYYYNAASEPVVLDALVESSATVGDATTLAAAELGKLNIRRSWDVDVIDRADVSRATVVGAPVWLWAPDDGLVDTANPVQYRGRVVYPRADRIVGKTWPIRPGMGVYLRGWSPGAGSVFSYLDLSPYVVGEDAALSLELGAAPRSSNG